MRETLAAALHTAKAGDDRRRTGTLRLVCAAIRDRDEANRAAGQDRLDDGEIAALVGGMIAQRKEAACRFAEAREAAQAEDEIAEIAVLRELLPAPVPAGELEKACREAVSETGSKGLRDVGRCMNALKERYRDSLDMTEACGVVRQLLR